MIMFPSKDFKITLPLNLIMIYMKICFLYVRTYLFSRYDDQHQLCNHVSIKNFPMVYNHRVCFKIPLMMKPLSIMLKIFPQEFPEVPPIVLRLHPIIYYA